MSVTFPHKNIQIHGFFSNFAKLKARKNNFMPGFLKGNTNYLDDEAFVFIFRAHMEAPYTGTE